MRERIELFAANIIHTVPDQIAAPVHEDAIKELTFAVNEALELAAKECEEIDNASYPHTRKWPSDCAAAIRKLKVE